MKIPDFRLERYFAEYEFNAPYLMCCSDCESYSAAQLFEMEPDLKENFSNLWLGYTESSGHPKLREQIAGLYTQTKPEHILVHSGAEEAIFNFMNAYLKTGDHVIVHFPCYQSLFDVAESIGCEVTPWQTSAKDEWSLDLDFLKKHLKKNTKAVIINNPHNPTGYLMNKPDFEGLAKLSQEHGFIIFSDEVYRFLEYDDKNRLPALCDMDERGVSLGVMSKSFGLAGLRIGWIATRNQKIFEKMAAFKDYTTICNSAPSEILAISALKIKKQIVARNLSIIHDNLDLLNVFFKKHEDLFQWNTPVAGPIAFPAIKTGNADTFCKNVLEKSGVLLLPGSLYHKDYRKHFRIGFGRKNMSSCLEKFDDYLSMFFEEKLT